MGHAQDPLLDLTMFSDGRRTCSGPTSGHDHVPDGWSHLMGHAQDPLLDLTMFRTGGAIGWDMLRAHFWI